MAATRPTAAELESARAIIARAKAADPRIRSADELLVCAAMALRAGEFNGVATHCAQAMGKTISRPKMVTDWVTRIEQLAAHLLAKLAQPQLIYLRSRGVSVWHGTPPNNIRARVLCRHSAITLP